MSFRLGRRAFLAGVGGAAVGLPVLEAMLDANGEALAQTSAPMPKRFVVCTAGCSLGWGNVPISETYVPSTVGAGYDLKRALTPFANHDNIKNEISVVTGLKIPWAGENGGTVPAGGRPNNHHETMMSPMLAGVRTQPSEFQARVYGTTADQIMADMSASATQFKSLVYRVQVSSYISSDPNRGAISYRLAPNATLATRVDPVISPKQAYDSLFRSFVPSTDSEAERRNYRNAGRRGVVDLVRGNAQRLMQRLGRNDQQRLQSHLEEIYALERGIAALPPEESAACVQLPAYAADPPIGGERPSGDYTTNSGYSNEDTRARLFCDLVHIALACDLTRSVSLMLTHFHSWMNFYPITGVQSDLHEIGHGKGTTRDMADAIAWHYKHFGYLVAKIRDTREGAASMLDNTVLVMQHEGGYGVDASEAPGSAQASSHSTENMAALIAGRVGGLRPGRHVRGNGRHPASVTLSAMRAAGHSGPLGEISATIPELFATS